MNLSEKDLEQFKDYIVKVEARSIFGDDHEIIESDFDEVCYSDDDESQVESVTVEMQIDQHGYDEISAFTFTRSITVTYYDDDFEQFYKDTDPIKLVRCL